jgi:hypothetical protein
VAQQDCIFRELVNPPAQKHEYFFTFGRLQSGEILLKFKGLIFAVKFELNISVAAEQRQICLTNQHFL